jgi:hypothetical protein
VVKLHAIIDASSPAQDQSHNQSNGFNSNNRYNSNSNKQQMEPVSTVALWETNGTIKLFTGSNDGFWRLWNFVPNSGFVKEFEHNM